VAYERCLNSFFVYFEAVPKGSSLAATLLPNDSQKLPT
jgi:hypothetical protein